MVEVERRQKSSFPPSVAGSGLSSGGRGAEPTRLARFSTMAHFKVGAVSYFIVGRSGTGKTLQVMERVLDDLMHGLPVLIFDAGMSYRTMCESMGGTYVSLHADGSSTVQVYGPANLLVYEAEELVFDGAQWRQDLPVPEAFNRTRFQRGLVVVDETARLVKAVPDLVRQVTAYVTSGAAFCVVGQTEFDVAAFRSLPGARVRMLSLSTSRPLNA